MLGWIALYRSIMEHWIWNTSDQRFKRWVYLLFCVTWQEKVVGFDDKEVRLKRGQLVTSVRRLCGLWNTSSSTVRNTLDAFEKHGMIKLTKDPNMTIITIVNYDKYQQGFGEQFNDTSFAVWPPPVAQTRAQSRAQTHYKQEINYNIINKNNISQPSVREEDFFEEFKKSEKSIEYAMRELHFDRDEVLEWLQKFKDYINYAHKEHRNKSDFNSHFLSWVNTKTNGGNGTDSKKQRGCKANKDKYSARRGTDAGDKSEEDYDTAF